MGAGDMCEYRMSCHVILYVEIIYHPGSVLFEVSESRCLGAWVGGIAVLICGRG